MRVIEKRREPASLTLHRSQAGATYENYADKDALRNQLTEEQHGLCCYCLSRIRVQYHGMKIEHWHSQAPGKYPEEQLDYSNLLAACMGNEVGNPENNTATPANETATSRAILRTQTTVLRNSRGFLATVLFGQTMAVFNQEINQVLNLNQAFLKNNRKEVLSAFTESLRKSGPLARHQLEKLLQKWNGTPGGGELKPYCQVVIYWLRKRLARV